MTPSRTGEGLGSGDFDRAAVFSRLRGLGLSVLLFPRAGMRRAASGQAGPPSSASSVQKKGPQTHLVELLGGNGELLSPPARLQALVGTGPSHPLGCPSAARLSSCSCPCCSSAHPHPSTGACTRMHGTQLTVGYREVLSAWAAKETEVLPARLPLAGPAASPGRAQRTQQAPPNPRFGVLQHKSHPRWTPQVVWRQQLLGGGIFC